MKFALALAALPAVALAAPCTAPELTASKDLAPVIKPAFACQDESKYTFILPEALPTPEQVKAVCAAPACQELIKAASTVKFPSCELPLGTSGSISIEKLFKSIVDGCKGGNGTAAGTPETAGSHAGSHGAAKENVEAPAAAGSKASGKNDAGKDASVTKVPAPSSTPKSSAASAAVGAAIAVACSVAAFVL
ncbi:hypothetical protein ATCC90586_004028 [Pythium insidiosum]|nr:hypothetical protein ATCC90586_004028 [Pythium insidiosum]